MNKIIVFQFLHFLFCRVLVRMSRLQQSYEYIIKRGPYFTHLLWKTKQFEVWTGLFDSNLRIFAIDIGEPSSERKPLSYLAFVL